MKKTYIQPQSEYTNLLSEVAILAVSNFTNEYGDQNVQF